MNFPHQRRSARDGDQKRPGRDGVDTVPPSPVSVPRARNAHGEAALLREGVQPPAEPTLPAFQRGVVQMAFRARKPTPPNSKASRTVTGGEVGIPDHTIHAVVTAVQKI